MEWIWELPNTQFTVTWGNLGEICRPTWQSLGPKNEGALRHCVDSAKLLLCCPLCWLHFQVSSPGVLTTSGSRYTSQSAAIPVEGAFLPQQYLDTVRTGSDQHDHSSITLHCGPRSGLARLKSHLLLLEVAYRGQLFLNPQVLAIKYKVTHKKVRI